MYSDDAWSSCSDAIENELGENDGFIDDDLVANNANIRLLEQTQVPEELHSSSELDNYLLDPDGLNMIDPFAIQQSLDNNDAHEGDPEPSPGPFDPG